MTAQNELALAHRAFKQADNQVVRLQLELAAATHARLDAVRALDAAYAQLATTGNPHA